MGLMAKKAEEYGSHDKTFEIAKAGKVVVKSSGGQELFSHEVETWAVAAISSDSWFQK